MANLSRAETLCHGIDDGGSYQYRQDWLGEGWYFSRKEIEDYSPSRRDGIRVEKETYLRRSYCDFLLELGRRLKLTQATIATATVFCHRFFLRQSHAKNDLWVIATVCMFLAGKAEENPRLLKDVILVSYGIIHEKDPKAVERIKEKFEITQKVFEQQKKLILLGEKVVLETLGYDLCVSLPYPALVEAIRKFNIPVNGLASVAWSFVNDGLQTSLCLQVKPLHIAAGAIFLAAKFLQIDLPYDDVAWWQEFEIRTWQLEEVCYQILEVYEEVQIPAPSEVEGTEASGAADQMPAQATASIEEHATSTETKDAPEENVQVEFKENLPPESLPPGKMEEAQSVAKLGLEGCGEEGQEENGNVDASEAGEVKDKQFGRSLVKIKVHLANQIRRGNDST